MLTDLQKKELALALLLWRDYSLQLYGPTLSAGYEYEFRNLTSLLGLDQQMAAVEKHYQPPKMTVVE